MEDGTAGPKAKLPVACSSIDWESPCLLENGQSKQCAYTLASDEYITTL